MKIIEQFVHYTNNTCLSYDNEPPHRDTLMFLIYNSREASVHLAINA